MKEKAVELIKGDITTLMLMQSSMRQKTHFSEAEVLMAPFTGLQAPDCSMNAGVSTDAKQARQKLHPVISLRPDM